MGLAGALGGAAHAQFNSQGQQLYQDHCVSCHGAAGAGNGWLNRFLNRAAPSLNDLARRNGGAFPEERVRYLVDGRGEIELHGPREMPVWGSDFSLEYARRAVATHPPVSPEPSRFPPPPGSEAYVRANIDALLAYLKQVQN